MPISIPFESVSLIAPNQLQQIRATQIMGLSSAASLTLWTYDWFLTLADERKFIWGTWRLNKRIKVLFLFMRYFSLIIQIVIRIWAALFLEPSYPVSPLRCTGFIVLGMVEPVVSSNCLDFLLLLRVWILFKRTRTSLILLGSILVLQIFLVIILVTLYIPHMNIDEYCIAHLSMPWFIFSGISNLSFQTVAWAFTMHQCRKAYKFAWGRHALVTLLERDGTTTWLGISSLLVVATVVNLVNGHLSALTNCWMSTVTSIAGCRMIINLQYLVENGDVQTSSNSIKPSVDVQLTTDISIPDVGSMWSDVDDHMMDSEQLPTLANDHR